MNELEACTRFVGWLNDVVLKAARGDDIEQIEGRPSGTFWLGRLAPEESVIARAMGDRGERLDPCAIGIVLQPTSPRPSFVARVRMRVWTKHERSSWRKTSVAEADIDISLVTDGEAAHGAAMLSERLAGVGARGASAEVRTELSNNSEGRPELTVFLVNTSPEAAEGNADTNLYECSLDLLELPTIPYLLAALPDSFRYDRRIVAYGVNCGVRVEDGVLRSTDATAVERGRPRYWAVDDVAPDLRFTSLAEGPIPILEKLVGALGSWGTVAWGDATLTTRARDSGWSADMLAQARVGASEFAEEFRRINEGLELLRADAMLLRAFRLMNEAIGRSSRGRYDSWRPFQIGFLLANIRCLLDVEEADTADIVWFATGGGKTETYLGLVVTAAFHDRLRGKLSGITAWNRFPLRMLSLQQTQRFADAMAAAELVRREHRIDGDRFSVGFFVGQGATPNRISPDAKQGEVDADTVKGSYKILLRCPFCQCEELSTDFDHGNWTLGHFCKNPSCAGGKSALPFFVVDEEIYRFLPTVVVGTLDKAALISMQASMRGFVGAPQGLCSKPGHGYTYAQRASRKTGCLVPECPGTAGRLPLDPTLYAPTLRLQDELHLLKDSLGAVDAHYEALFDHLQLELSGRRPKILGSSATLTGYAKQVDVLYRRDARVFPAAGPSNTEGFWTSESDELARRFVALAPRGVTVEFAVDRIVTEVQRAVRKLRSDPAVVCQQAGIEAEHAVRLVDLYGVDVVYGNTLRDLEAVTRSFETQIQVDGPLRTASLTGRTDFDEVRAILQRLDQPEPNFDDRIHLIAASAMMSHGVDIDRLNVMLIMGLPLTTAEFIQTSARVGRRHPGLVFVMPKMARERDASVFRVFEQFVRHGDRLVEAVPIGRRSRRVLERTMPGLLMARILHLHEPKSGRALTSISALRDYFRQANISPASEGRALVEALGFDGTMEEDLREDIRAWLEGFFERMRTPPSDARFISDLSPGEGPMRSLRDVEEQVPVMGVSR